MNIYLTESEYDAISFAWSQIATEIEASSDYSIPYYDIPADKAEVIEL